MKHTDNAGEVYQNTGNPELIIKQDAQARARDMSSNSSRLDNSRNTNTSSNNSSAQNNIDPNRPRRIVVIGATGTGKTSLANFLMGGLDSTKRKGVEGNTLDSETKYTEMFPSNWFGDTTKEKIEVIDTPGLNEKGGIDGSNIAKMIAFLKELGHVDTFIITFQFQFRRIDSIVIKILNFYVESFGSEIWQNVIFCFTSYYTSRKKQRQNQFNTLQEFLDKVRKEFPSMRNISPPVRCVSTNNKDGDLEEPEDAEENIQTFELLKAASLGMEAFSTKRIKPASYDGERVAPNIPDGMAKLLEQNAVQQRIIKRQDAIRIYLNKLTPKNSLEFFPVIRVLGNGSDGVVYLSQFDGQDLAVKVMYNFYGKFIESHYQKEYEILLGLEYHENIVQLYTHFHTNLDSSILSKLEVHFSIRDILLDKQTLCFTMEHHQLTLAAYLQKNNASQEQRLSWCRQIGQALLFLQEKNIVHLDIKLDNIMLSHDFTPIIADFGCSVVVDKFGCATGAHGGNLMHLAPEVLSSDRNRKVSYSKQPSWEFGVVCWEILTGNLPFPYYLESPRTTVLNMSVLLQKNMPKEINSAIEKLLKEDPSQRTLLKPAVAIFEFNALNN